MSNGVTALTRRTLVASGAAGGVALLAACDPLGREASPRPIAGPKEITWSCYQLGELREKAWNETWRLAEPATGVKITVQWEPGAGYWDKRQVEFSAGTPGPDIIVNQVNWFIPGGINGMFVDHYEYMRRDKIDPKQYFQAVMESFAWKGKLWSLPFQFGGDMLYFNKGILDAKGVKHPSKNSTMDELLDAARRLTDAANNKFGIDIQQNTLPLVMGTFILNFGGKLLNDAADRVLYGDDVNAIRGAEFNVDLHVRHRVTPNAEARATLPAGKQPIEVQMVAMQIVGSHRIVQTRDAIGANNLDFAPIPKGPAGIQTQGVGGNAWSLMSQSKAKDAAWAALKWTHTKEGMLGPQIPGLSWPPLIWAANSPQWMDQFKGTHMADVQKVWETAGRTQVVTPEGDKTWTTMSAPLSQALRGELATRDAMQQSARETNALFAERPAAWR